MLLHDLRQLLHRSTFDLRRLLDQCSSVPLHPSLNRFPLLVETLLSYEANWLHPVDSNVNDHL